MMHNDSNLAVSVWQDTRPVVAIASNSDPAVSTSVTRKNNKLNRSLSKCSCTVQQVHSRCGSQ